MAAAKDMVGERFVRLTVASYSGARLGNAQWNCLCDCGNTITVSRPNLLSGNTQSCGCLNAELSSARRTTHGHTSGKSGGKKPSKTHNVWGGMLHRCRDSGNTLYFGRGITVCDEWKSFENFLTDMGECPDGHSLDRINNNLGYSPDNCRWASPKQQSRNRRSNRVITYAGVSLPIAAWSEFTRIAGYNISHHIDRNHRSVGQALGFE